MDYRGDDIKNKIVKNQEECAKFCAETKGALFWTYFDKIKRCWVKRANSKKIPDVRLVSGNRQCGLTGNFWPPYYTIPAGLAFVLSHAIHEMKGNKFAKQSDSADKFQVKWAYGTGRPPCQPHPLQPSRINSTDWECLYSGSSPTWQGQCVMDKRSPRVLPDVRLVLKKDNTPTLCISKCKGKGFAYAGVEYGWECFCANVPPPSDAIVDKKQCNKKCSGDQNMICGGSWRINVFKTGIMNHFNCLNNWDSNFLKIAKLPWCHNFGQSYRKWVSHGVGRVWKFV